MLQRSHRAMEYAMTHRAGVTGLAERYERPGEVRTLVERVQKWAVAPEACQNCQSLPAVRFAELPLCGRCHAQRAERLGLRKGDVVGLRPVVERAEELPTNDKRLEGYAIRFNEKSVELWGFFEIIRPSAADRLVSDKPDLRALWNHDSAEPMGRVSAGTLRVEKRTRGVWVEIDPPQSAAARIESVARRDVTGQSFGFVALTDDWWLEDGIPHREILDMEVIEISPVSFPAYPSTTITAVNASARSEWHVEQKTAERLRLVR